MLVLWLASYISPAGWAKGWTEPAGQVIRRHEFGSVKGRVYLAHRRMTVVDRWYFQLIEGLVLTSWYRVAGGGMPEPRFEADFRLGTSETFQRWTVLGVDCWRDRASGAVAHDYRVFSAPYWLMTGTLIAPPVLLRLRRRVVQGRRERAGLCRECGYDVRATPDRCPECGAAAPALAKAESINGG